MSTGSNTGTLTATESFIPSSAVSISNMALGYLGAQPITSIDENTQGARYCKIHYDNTRDATLRAFPWNFAETRVILGSVDVPTEHAHWDYAYAWPSDCMRALKVTIQEDTEQVSQKYEVAVDALAVGGFTKLIFTNAVDAVLTYTAKVEDTTLFDPEFVSAMALLLASRIAVPVTKSTKFEQAMLIKYNAALMDARTSDAKEGEVIFPATDPWEVARLGGG